MAIKSQIYSQISRNEQGKIIRITNSEFRKPNEVGTNQFTSKKFYMKMVSKRMLLEENLNFNEIVYLKVLRDNLQIGLSEKANEYIKTILYSKSKGECMKCSGIVKGTLSEAILFECKLRHKCSMFDAQYSDCLIRKDHVISFKEDCEFYSTTLK